MAGISFGIFLMVADPVCGRAAAGAKLDLVPGADPRIQASDFLKRGVTEAGAVYFDRIADIPGRGFRWSSPGTRFRFRTDGAEVVVHLHYTDRHLGASARNGAGFFRIDGRGEAAWTFDRPAGSSIPGKVAVNVAVPVPTGGAFHDYELILPYSDAVELAGVSVSAGAKWAVPAGRPKVRWVAFGDSVTQGFTASDVLHTYPFLVGEAKGWQVINTGFGGRGCQASDGEYLAGIEAEIYSIAIGVNNWQVGTSPETFRSDLAGLLKQLHKGRPTARIFVISPLWVPPSWSPAKIKYPLTEYRKVTDEVVSGLGDTNIRVVDGASLIDHDPALFDKVAVHPNDAGFAQMAARLAAIFQ
ncbi:MAG: GDSL-type esterase/lipase family protein [Opitutaceae bacterium]